MCRSMADISGSIDITKNREVLPTNVVPRHYDLTLEPDFKKFTFDGTGELRAGAVVLLCLLT
jgi:aminopeptidase 2